jgi:hypothetical protein
VDDPVTLERRGWQALSRSGAAARRFYDEVLADDVLMLLPGGLRLTERDATLDAMSGTPWTSFELDDVALRTVTSDVAVVAYRATAQRDEAAYRALCSSTYVREAAGWKLCVHQQTPL